MGKWRKNAMALSLITAALCTLAIVNGFDDFYSYTQFNVFFYTCIYFSVFGLLTSVITLISCLKR